MVDGVVMKSKEVFHQGVLLEDLKKLNIRETAKYLEARSRRSVLRNFQTIEQFVNKCLDYQSKKRKIRTHLRDIVIVPQLVGVTIYIYNGKTFNEVLITAKMIGHRLGEFSLTRNKVSHGKAGVGATKGSRSDKK